MASQKRAEKGRLDHSTLTACGGFPWWKQGLRFPSLVHTASAQSPFTASTMLRDRSQDTPLPCSNNKSSALILPPTQALPNPGWFYTCVHQCLSPAGASCVQQPWQRSLASSHPLRKLPWEGCRPGQTRGCSLWLWNWWRHLFGAGCIVPRIL